MTVTKVVPSSPNAMVRNDFNFVGLSADTKPQKAPVNALFLELDTKTLYYCAKQGSKGKETVYDDTIELNSGIEDSILGVITLADTITVVFDGIEYANLQKQTGGSYGATWDESTQSIDFSVYPFRVHYSEGYNSFAVVENVGEHTISIYSNDELVIEKTFNAYYFGLVLLEFGRGRELSGNIKFVVGDEEYACEQQIDQYSDEYYGAPRDGDVYDFSVYPFSLSPSGTLALSKPRGEYHISIVEDVETPATWVKYGEAPSTLGNLVDGVTIEPSDWVYDEGADAWVYEVEYYPLETGTGYVVEWERDGESITMDATAEKDGNTVGLHTDVYVIVSTDNGKTFVTLNEQETETITNLKVFID